MGSGENEGKSRETGPAGAAAGDSDLTPTGGGHEPLPAGTSFDGEEEPEVEIIAAPAPRANSGEGWAYAVEEWSQQIYIEPSLREPLPGSFAQPEKDNDPLPALPGERRTLPDYPEGGPAAEGAATPATAALPLRSPSDEEEVDEAAVELALPPAPLLSGARTASQSPREPSRPTRPTTAEEGPAPLPPPPASSASPAGSQPSSPPQRPTTGLRPLGAAAAALASALMEEDEEVQWSSPRSPVAALIDDFYDDIDIAIDRLEQREVEVPEAPRWARGPASADSDELALDFGEGESEIIARRQPRDSDRTPVPGDVARPVVVPEGPGTRTPRTIHMEADLPPDVPDEASVVRSGAARFGDESSEPYDSQVTPAAPAAVVAAALAASAATPSTRLPAPASAVTMVTPATAAARAAASAVAPLPPLHDEPLPHEEPAVADAARGAESQTTARGGGEEEPSWPVLSGGAVAAPVTGEITGRSGSVRLAARAPGAQPLEGAHGASGAVRAPSAASSAPVATSASSRSGRVTGAGAAPSAPVGASRSGQVIVAAPSAVSARSGRAQAAPGAAAPGGVTLERPATGAPTGESRGAEAPLTIVEATARLVTAAEALLLPVEHRGEGAASASSGRGLPSARSVPGAPSASSGRGLPSALSSPAVRGAPSGTSAPSGRVVTESRGVAALVTGESSAPSGRGALSGVSTPAGRPSSGRPSSGAPLLGPRPRPAPTHSLAARRLPLPVGIEAPPPPTLRAALEPGLSASTRRAFLSVLDEELARTPAEEPERAAVLAWAAGHQAEALGESAEASDRYRRASDAAPRLRAAQRGLRRLLAQPGPAAAPDEALQLLERELEGATSDAERAALQILRGELFLHQGQDSGARTCYQEILMGGPAGRIAALSGLADTAALRGPSGYSDLAVAVDALGDALSVASSAEPAAAKRGLSPLRAALQIERARIDERSGRLPTARSRYEVALLNPGQTAGVPAGFGLLRLALRTPAPSLVDDSRSPLAVAQATVLGALSPSPLRAALLRQEVLLAQRGARLGAGKEPAKDDTKGRAARTREGRSGPAAVDPAAREEAALARLRSAAELGDRVAREDLAERLARDGRSEEAARHLLLLAQDDQVSPADQSLHAELLIRAGERLAEAGLYGEARGALVTALAVLEKTPSAPRDPLALRALRRVQEQEGRLADRRVLLRQTAAERTGSAAYFLVELARLSLLHAATADLPAAEVSAARAEARAVLQAALQERPRYASAVTLLREALLLDGQLEAAAQLLLAHAPPDDVTWVEEAAGLYWRAGQEVVAARLLQAVVDNRGAAAALATDNRGAAAALATDRESRSGAAVAESSLRLRSVLRWQIQRMLWGKVALAPESAADLSSTLAELLRTEAETSPDMQRVADLWYRRGLLMHSLYPLVTREAGPAEDSLARALLAEPAHGEALGILLERTLAAEDDTARGTLVPLVARALRERLAAATGRPEAAVHLQRLASLQMHEAHDPGGALQTLEQLHELAPLVMASAAEDPLLLHLALRAGATARIIELWDAELNATDDLEQRFTLLLQIGEWLRISEDPSGAAERFAAALELRPGHKVAREALAEALRHAGQWEALMQMARAEAESGSDIVQKTEGYERMAVLGLLQQRPDVAVQAYHDILTLDANHHLAMRALERHYLARRDDGELIHLYSQMGLVATEPSFAVHVHLERARLRQRLAWQQESAGTPPKEMQGELQSELENDFRLALYRDGHSRPALRQLLATALRTHDLQQVADLSARLADICDQAGSGRGEAGDGRAAAVFLTRAAECHRVIGRSPEFVVQAYRAALERNPRHVPALRGLLHLLLEQRSYADGAAVAEHLAAAMHDPEERYDALMLSASVAQEQLSDTDRALSLLREALRIGASIGRSDAFDRLRVILAGLAGVPGDPLALTDLIRERLQIETDPRRQVSLRLELGLLIRDALGNRPRAKVELRAALAIEPTHEAVLDALAALHFQDGDWTEAADLLMRRARVERRPEELADIYLRLGEIYGSHLPDPRRATLAYSRVLEILPEHRVALTQLAQLHQQQGRPEAAVPLVARLAELATERDAKVGYLHKLAQLQEARGERRGALEALRHAVELDPMNLPAVGELARFFDRQSDVQSMRVHLDRSAARWLQVLRERPEDTTAFRALLQIFLWRRAMDQATMAAEILAQLEGEASLPPEGQALLQAQARKPSYPGEALRDPSWDEQLFPPSIPPGLRNLFELLQEPLEKLYRVETKQLSQQGIERRERLPRSGHPLRDLANRIAADLGMRGDFDIYLTAAQGKDSNGRPAPLCTLEATDPPALILSQSLTSGATEDELRFFLGRLLKLLQRRLLLPLRLSPEDLGLVVGGLVRQFVPDYVPIGFAEKRIIAEAQQLSRVIPRKLHPQVLPLAMECASASLEWGMVEETLWRCANRAGLLLAGRLRPALAALRRLGAEAQLRELRLFAVSAEFAEQRRTLGTHLG